MEQSKAAYYADFILFPLVIVGLIAREIQVAQAFPYLWLCSMAFGLLIWTFVEYGVHRFILHSIEVFARLHKQHHRAPGAYVGTPAWVSLLSFALCGFAPALILFGWEVASGATIGLMFGYLWYLLVHDAVHRRHPPRGSLMWRAKMRHACHHHGRLLGNFGVTSAYWDLVFGTDTRTTRFSVSHRADRGQVVRNLMGKGFCS